MSKILVPDRTIVTATPGGLQKFLMAGKHRVQHFDRRGRLKGEYEFLNGITNQGKNYLLNAAFNAGAQIGSTSWYIGLIDNSGSPALAAGDLLSSHAGWTEFTGYSGSRPAWGQGSASGQAVTNASPATFSITATSDTLYGIFIASVASGGSSSDILWSTAAFSATVPVASGDSMKCSYTIAT
jgi:hypothetical protein